MSEQALTYAWIYDADFGRFQADLPLYSALAGRTGGPLLELMCGTGRVLLPLAAEGYSVTGVDIDPQMLSLAHQKVVSAGLEQHVELIEADVRAGRLPGGFALAIVAINSFMHLLTVDDQLSALRQIYQALKPGGLLALDLFSPYWPGPHPRTGQPGLTDVLQIDGRRMLKFVALTTDLLEQLDHVTTTYEGMDAQGQPVQHRLTLTFRWHYRYELEHLLVRSGFELDSVWGGYDGWPYEDTSERLIVVARKKHGPGRL